MYESVGSIRKRVSDASRTWRKLTIKVDLDFGLLAEEKSSGKGGNSAF